MTQPRQSDSGWQDPSTDIENVNAAYRIEHELATVYRETLQRLLVHPALTAGASAPQLAALRIVREALTFDPLR